MTDVRRSGDQKVEAFSAPLDLLQKARKEAAGRAMSKSGFFRYCLAKELGYSESEALAISRDIRMEKANVALREKRADKSAG